jgi:hypothetical protein
MDFTINIAILKKISASILMYLIIDYCAAAFFLGIVTAEQLIKLRSGKDETPETPQ